MESSNIENDINNKKKLECTQSLRRIKEFFPFLYKLHMIANKPNHPFAIWSDCGQHLQFDYMGMQDYLMSNSSIFYEKSMLQFLERLCEFKFTKVVNDCKSAVAEIFPPKVWLTYEHPNFQRDHNELIEKIEGCNELYEYVPLASPKKKKMYEDCIGEPSNSHHRRKRARGDLCSANNEIISRVEHTRIRLHLQLRFQREQSVLMHKVTEADTVSVKKVEQKGSRIVTRVTNEPVVKLPDNKYESPLETNLAVQNTINPDLAGFYGIADYGKIKDFFGEYLPRRDNDTIVIEVPEIEPQPDQGETQELESSVNQNIEDEDEPVGSDHFGDAEADDLDDDDDYVANNDFKNMELSETSKSIDFGSPNTANYSIDDEIQNAFNTLCDEPEEKMHDGTNLLKDPMMMEFFNESDETSTKKMKFTNDAAGQQGSEIDEPIESNSFGDFFAQIEANTKSEDMDFDFDFDL